MAAVVCSCAFQEHVGLPYGLHSPPHGLSYLPFWGGSCCEYASSRTSRDIHHSRFEGKYWWSSRTPMTWSWSTLTMEVFPPRVLRWSTCHRSLQQPQTASSRGAPGRIMIYHLCCLMYLQCTTCLWILQVRFPGDPLWPASVSAHKLHWHQWAVGAQKSVAVEPQPWNPEDGAGADGQHIQVSGFTLLKIRWKMVKGHNESNVSCV